MNEFRLDHSYPIKVLLIEDNPGDRRLIQEMLAEADWVSFDLECADNLSTGLERLEIGVVDVVLLDLLLPDSEGVDSLVKVHAHVPEVPIVVLTITDDDLVGLDIIKHGAQDYLVKGRVNTALLVRAIRYAIERKRVEEALRKAHDELEIRVQERTAELAKANQALQAEITERKRSEEELAVQWQRLETTLRNISDGVILIDAKSQIVLANPTGHQYLSLLREGRAGDILTHLGNQPIEIILGSTPEGRTCRELVYKERIFEMTAQPIEAECKASGWILVIRDVTRESTTRHRIETQERLAAVGQLAAGIAHDFNNSLTVIIGFSEVLQRDPTISDKAHRQLDSVVQQGHRASQLVRQILDFSRQSISERYPLDLLSFVKENLKLLERTIPEHIRINLDFTAAKYWVLADVSKMQQVLTNLALNARDAMPEGGELRIRLVLMHFKSETQPLLPEMEPGDWITLSVSDTGNGIAPEHMSHIFEPFFTTKEIGKGSGLGLSQVYGIVKQHEGFIDVTSKVREGATFTIYLPAIADQDMVVPKEIIEAISGDGETILLVEDEPIVLETNKAMLEELRYNVLAAINGQEALRVFDQRHDEIALIITDMVMPEMDGVALFQALKQRNPNVKVLVTTGYPLVERAKEFLTIGVLDWIQKPMDFIHLSKTLARALGKEL